MGGHQTRHGCARACRCNPVRRRTCSVESSSILLCRPRGIAWVNLCLHPATLTPGPMMARPPPLWWRERSFPLTLIGRFLIVSIKPKEPSPLCTEDGSYLRGTHLAGQARGILIDRQAMPLLGAPDIKPASSKCHIARRVRHQANAKSVCIPCLNVQFTATPRPGATSLFQ